MAWAIDGAALALVAARTAHFIATALTAGVLLFRAVIGAPATMSSPASAQAADAQARQLAGWGLLVSVLSGTIWFVLTAADMGNLAVSRALHADVLTTVAEATQFGSVAVTRLVLALLLGASLAFDGIKPLRWLTLALALGLMASIAWTGHGGSGFGVEGDLRVAADALHLIAASAWIGGLVPLALLLGAALRNDSPMSIEVARVATQRFSLLGIASVGTLVATGSINAWFLVGSSRALFGTEYGRVLLAKLALFAVMLSFAAFNRTILTPRLLAPATAESQPSVVRTLTRHCVVEFAIGLIILGIVGWLGTLHPASHFMN
jgi:putative copper resistance protein D